MSKTTKKTSYREKMIRHYKIDPDMKLISYKGAFCLTGVVILSTVIIPFVLTFLGMNPKLSLVVSSSVVGGIGVAIVRCFIETKRGFGRGFVFLTVVFGLSFLIIAYYWTYYHYYI